MCDCIERIDAQLAERNAKLPVGINFNTGAVNLILKLSKVDSRKKLGAAFIAPTFCPFCGEKAQTGEARGTHPEADKEQSNG